MVEIIKRKRSPVLKGFTYQIKTGCGPLYVTINSDDIGEFEIFATMGKAGGCAISQTEAIGRMVSLGLQFNVPIQRMVHQLQGISCHSPMGVGDEKVLSCADAVSKAIQIHLKKGETK